MSDVPDSFNPTDCGTCGLCGAKMPPNYEPCDKCGNNGLVVYD